MTADQGLRTTEIDSATIWNLRSGIKLWAGLCPLGGSRGGFFQPLPAPGGSSHFCVVATSSDLCLSSRGLLPWVSESHVSLCPSLISTTVSGLRAHLSAEWAHSGALAAKTPCSNQAHSHQERWRGRAFWVHSWDHVPCVKATASQYC